VLGSLETAAALRLPRVLATFAAAYPKVNLSLITGTTAALVEQVLDGRIEGGFVAGPVHHPELREETIYHEELVLVTARTVRGWDDLPQQRDLKIVVFRSGCSYRQRLEAMLAERGVVGVRTLEFGTLEGIIGCVAAGIGVTILPRGVITPAWRKDMIAIHPSPPTERYADTVFVRRTDGYASSALAAFLQFARPVALHEVSTG
jgi:DNA-binding transcriptional LysR family regulator